MKQRLLILAAATAVAFAACNGGNNEGSYSQAQVDSMAKAQQDSIAAALKAQNDSTIAAQATLTADSLRMVTDSLANVAKGATATNVTKKSGTKNTSKPQPKPDLTTGKVTPTPTPTAQQQKFQDRQNSSKTITEEKKQEQKSKFDSRK